MKPTAAALALALVACGAAKSASKPPQASVIAPQALAEAVAARRLDEAAKAPARSHWIGTIARRAIGPFSAFTADGGVVTWIAEAERGGGEELVAVALGPDGAPVSPPRVVASFPQEATSLVVRTAGPNRRGWVAVYSTLLDRGESLAAVGIAPDGTARANPVDIQRTNDHVKWADVIATAHGPVCVWAEETASGEANLLTATLDGDGKPRGMPARVARAVVGWSAVPAEDGIGVALVTTGASEGSSPTAPHAKRPADDRDRSAAGVLTWLRLDADGRPLAPPLPIGARPTVSGDVDVASTPDGFLLAWTDRTGEDAHVSLALVAKTGRVRGPVLAMDAVGGSMLAGLVSGDRGTLLAWEEPRGRARPMRTLHFASVATAEAPAAEPVTSLQIAAANAPELAATGDGFAIMASAPVCGAAEAPDDGTSPPPPRLRGGVDDARERGRNPAACAGPLAPTFIRLDSRLVPVQAEPMLVGDSRASAALGWNLRCTKGRCLALAATSEAPTPIYTVDLPPRASPFAPPVELMPPASAPRLNGIATIASGQPFTDVAAARVGETTFVAAMTIGPRGAAERRDRSRGASVTLRRIDGSGLALGPAATLTSRAAPVGGIALAAGARPEDGVVAAWVARDGADSHVHLARFDASGRRRADVQLTTGHGAASDVALAWAGAGWLVAWVDTRDGNGEVYAARVDGDLRRLAGEQRITRAPGDAGDVALAIAGDVAWLAWSDARESPREGVADVYVTTLRAKDAHPLGDETKVLATAGHSRSPAVAATGEGTGGMAVVAWIEDAPPGVDAPGAVMAARVDAQAHLAGAPARLPLAAEGKPSAIALERAGSDIRAVVARTWRDEVTLDAAKLSSDLGTPSAVWPLVDLDAPGSFDVALALSGDGLYFDDLGSAASDHRLRRASVDWRR